MSVERGQTLPEGVVVLQCEGLFKLADGFGVILGLFRLLGLGQSVGERLFPACGLFRLSFLFGDAARGDFAELANVGAGGGRVVFFADLLNRALDVFIAPTFAGDFLPVVELSGFGFKRIGLRRRRGLIAARHQENADDN